ncbi:uncharacterized protein LOC135119569 [Zophobas morio]|uniref:uncharacterized protein LOC135119569 n=1 Tax=Zophobas morio TaxID=2755281 RepID=UPI003082DCC2
MLENENNWLDSSAFKSAQTNEILFLLQEFLYSKPEDPFVEVCQLLDEFSLSLQLSYLHVQANFLNSEKWASFLKIVFTKNSHLLIYYWRNFQHFDLRPINEQEKPFIKIYVSLHDHTLKVEHFPSLEERFDINLGRVASSCVVSLDKLLSHLVRSYIECLLDEIMLYLRGAAFSEKDHVSKVCETYGCFLKVEFLNSFPFRVDIHNLRGHLTLTPLFIGLTEPSSKILNNINLALSLFKVTLLDSLNLLKTELMKECIYKLCFRLNLQYFQSLPIVHPSASTISETKTGAPFGESSQLFILLSKSRYLKITVNRDEELLLYELLTVTPIEPTSLLLTVSSTDFIFISPSSFLANSCELHETVLANKKHLLTLHVFEAIQQAQVKFIISEVSNHLENFNIHFSLQLLCDYSGFNESSEDARALFIVKTIPPPQQIRSRMAATFLETSSDNFAEISLQTFGDHVINKFLRARILWKEAFLLALQSLKKDVFCPQKPGYNEDSIFLQYDAICEESFAQFINDWQRIIVTTSLALTSNERVVVNQKDANEWDYNITSFDYENLSIRFRLCPIKCDIWATLHIKWISDKVGFLIKSIETNSTLLALMNVFILDLLNSVEDFYSFSLV